MNSREKILTAVAGSQPAIKKELPEIQTFPGKGEEMTEKFIEVLEKIGGMVYQVATPAGIPQVIRSQFKDAKKIVAGFSPGWAVHGVETLNLGLMDPHALENVDLAIVKAALGVAENGAVWVTEAALGQRVLPFICQHLAVLLCRADVVATLHDAYDRIGTATYGFGTFIAGPSKTADIEQSLVLGAHGPKSVTVFLIDTIA